MQTEIITAGFGGQGVLFGGMLLAQAAMEEKLHTTWFPAYGAEMRGGTANATVIISREEIGSPIVLSPSGVIALNALSLTKFLPRAKPGGVVVYNASLVTEHIERPGVTVIALPASEIADKELGDMRVANLIMIGAYLKASGALALSSAQKACEKVLAEKPKLIALNRKALETGYQHAK